MPNTMFMVKVQGKVLDSNLSVLCTIEKTCLNTQIHRSWEDLFTALQDARKEYTEETVLTITIEQKITDILNESIIPPLKKKQN